MLVKKAEVLDKFGFWALGIIKKKINESFKVLFLWLWPNACLGCLANIIYA